jgi:hypothetical protein
MAGAEIDRAGRHYRRAVLDITQVMEVQNSSCLELGYQIRIGKRVGGIEDKRRMPAENINPEKVLILRGTSVFGGIDIRNY